MDKNEEMFLKPVELLLSLAKDTKSSIAPMSDKIDTLNAILNDFGEGMDADIQATWEQRLSEIISDCDKNTFNLTTGMQKFCLTTLRAVEGNYYTIIKKVYPKAAKCYEYAAETMGSMQQKQLVEPLMLMLTKEPIVTVQELVQNKDPETFSPDDYKAFDNRVEEVEKQHDELNKAMSFGLRFPEVGLWIKAGDSYFRSKTHILEARRCYERGIKILENDIPSQERNRFAHSRLLLSVAAIDLPVSEKWNGIENIYRKAANKVFFEIEKKDNEAYHDLCSILVFPSTSLADFSFQLSSWVPNMTITVDKENNEKLSKLQAELGQRALETLQADYESSDEGFPLPETYYLASILGGLYNSLKEYEKCKNLINTDTTFGEGFWFWPWEELRETHEWVIPYVSHAEHSSFAEGILKRPDYQEFLNELKKSEERYQKQLLGQIRIEERLKTISGRYTIEEYGSELLKKYPWIERVRNSGSLVNGEFLYRHLKQRNWGEVVGSYSNALEEELKQYLAEKYLKYVLKKDETTYKQESERKGYQGALGLIANLVYIPKNESIKRPSLKYQALWEPFIKMMFPGDVEFLKDLPHILSDFTELRRKSVHGSMSEQEKAEKAREIVLGTNDSPGLLKNLIDLKADGEKAG